MPGTLLVVSNLDALPVLETMVCGADYGKIPAREFFVSGFDETLAVNAYILVSASL